MGPLTVRPLEPGEDALWRSAGRADDAQDETQKETRQEGAAPDPRCRLLAFEGTRPVGRLRGTFLAADLFTIRELRSASETDFDHVADAFARFLSASFAPASIEILAWDAPESAATNAALRRGGFVVAKEKFFFERQIDGYRSPYDDPFDYRSLAELGEDRFVELVALAAEGDPFEEMTSSDPRKSFRELVEYAGEAFDAAWWRAAFLAATPVGVVLPQVYPDSPTEGTLFYVGVLPPHRGLGYGRTLHAWGLTFLADHGVTRYVGSTDSRNLPMIAVFRANACEQTGVQLFYKALKTRP